MHRPIIAKIFHLYRLEEKLFFKSIPLNFLNIKTQKPNRQKRRAEKMTRKGQKYSDLTMTVDRRPSYNTGFAKVAVQCFV